MNKLTKQYTLLFILLAVTAGLLQGEASRVSVSQDVVLTGDVLPINTQLTQSSFLTDADLQPRVAAGTTGESTPGITAAETSGIAVIASTNNKVVGIDAFAAGRSSGSQLRTSDESSSAAASQAGGSQDSDGSGQQTAGSSIADVANQLVSDITATISNAVNPDVLTIATSTAVSSIGVVTPSTADASGGAVLGPVSDAGAPTPEPATMALAGLVLTGIAVVGRKARRPRR